MARRLECLKNPTENTKILYAVERRLTDRIIRQKKRVYGKQLFKEVEKSRKLSRSFFRQISFARGIYKPQNLILTDDGERVVSTVEQADDIGRYFEKVINHKASVEKTEPKRLHVMEEEVIELTSNEIKTTLKALKYNKAPGGSSINA